MSAPAKIDAARRQLAAAHRELEEALRGARGPRRGALTADLWKLRCMLSAQARHFSQFGQDWFVDQRLLRGKRDGVFVDIGGYDGVTGSNTLFFELFRSWRGLVVEADPEQADQARAVRRCPCLNVAVGAERGEAEFLKVTSGYRQMSGLRNSYDAGTLERVRQNPEHAEEILTVEMLPLADILADHGFDTVDYLSLDVEGAELTILNAFPFDAIEVDVWSIENNRHNPEIPRLMQAQGYDLVEFLGVDEVYRRARR